jgi:hypothetical protein
MRNVLPTAMRDWHMHLMIVASLLGPIGMGLCLLNAGALRLCGAAFVAISIGCLIAHSYGEYRAGNQMIDQYRRDLRNNIVGLVRLLASKDEQLAYQRDVPIANVPAELVCMWFDDLYHPYDNVFSEVFSPAECERLARFHEFFDVRHKHLPATLPEMHNNSEWLDVMAEARRVLDDLGW